MAELLVRQEEENSLADEAIEIYKALLEKVEFPWQGLNHWEPKCIGPSWKLNENGEWNLPEKSLGWECLIWCYEYLKNPLNRDEGWLFTAEQARLILWWFALDENGEFLFFDGVIQRVKGWGKDPFGAVLCAFEMLGPCRFSGQYYKHGPIKGQPVGEPINQAWVQTAAVAEKQTKNTMTLLPALFNERAKKDYFRLQIGKFQVWANNDIDQFEAVTSNPATLEGARSTFVLMNETQHWKSNNSGHEMSEVIGRNTGKSSGGTSRRLRITNAFLPGEDSVAERDKNEWLAQQAEGVSNGLFYDSLEAPENAPLTEEAAEEICFIVRGNSYWLTPSRMAKEVLDRRVPESTRRRFWYNQITASEESWLASFEWKSRASPRPVKPKEMITLGFDGSRQRSRKTTDATAIIACSVFDKYIFEPLEKSVWEQPSHIKYNWQIPTQEVVDSIAEIFNRYNVVGFFADPAKWEGWVAQWEAQYGPRLKVRSSQPHPIEWWMTGGRGLQIVRVVDQFHSAVIDGELIHGDSYYLNKHIANCRNFPTTSGMQIAKEFPDSPNKIDAAIAAVLAYEATICARSKGLGVKKLSSFVPRRIN